MIGKHMLWVALLSTSVMACKDAKQPDKASAPAKPTETAPTTSPPADPVLDVDAKAFADAFSDADAAMTTYGGKRVRLKGTVTEVSGNADTGHLHVVIDTGYVGRAADFQFNDPKDFAKLDDLKEGTQATLVGTVAKMGTDNILLGDATLE